MQIIHGRNLIVTLDGAAIAGAISCDINVKCEEIEISSPSQGSWREFLAGRKEWTVSIDHLILANAARLTTEAEMVGQTVTLQIKECADTGILTGKAIITGWKATGTRGNLAHGSFTFRGVGLLGNK